MSASVAAVRLVQSASSSVALLNRTSMPVRKTECISLAALCESHGRSLREVACEVSERAIVLQGTVATYYEKQLAQELVRKYRIGWRVDNRIEVKYEAE